jgi:hypothetical protein
VLISEGVRNFEALGRSYRLVKGRFWPTSGALAVMALVQLAIALVLFVPATVVLFSGGAIVLAIVLLVAAGLLSSAILYPLLGTVIASIYLDLRSRERLGLGPGSTAAPPLPPDPERPAGTA